MSEEYLIAKANRNWLSRKGRKGPVSRSHPWYSSPTRDRKRRQAKIMKQLETGTLDDTGNAQPSSDGLVS